VDGSGKCDAYETHDPSHSVIGVVFEIDEHDKANLDRIEGFGSGYEQKKVALTASTGETIVALTYYATTIDPELRPYIWYKHHVLTGAIENGLPEEYIEKIRAIESIEDPKPERHKREMGLY
jgi:gamma-glutamylcyclotransferase (GGCT)/AIG2-like uncharacterized protein YtfP